MDWGLAKELKTEECSSHARGQSIHVNGRRDRICFVMGILKGLYIGTKAAIAGAKHLTQARLEHKAETDDITLRVTSNAAGSRISLST